MKNAAMEQSRRRSKTGCLTCRKRKIKCDEIRPVCGNCVRFAVSCRFADALQKADGGPGTSDRRGRGRPRKDWASILTPATAQAPASPMALHSEGMSPLGLADTARSLNAVDVDLLLHFATHAGPSLADPDDPDNDTSYFWAHNAPQFGMRYTFVLHLMFSLSAHHMMRFGYRLKAPLDPVLGPDRTDRDHLQWLVSHHFSAGLCEMAELLPSLDANNCAALYVSSLLVMRCTFAAGPQGPDDLLVCDLRRDGEGPSNQWRPLMQGVRLIRETMGEETLFAGLMTPIGPRGDRTVCGPTADRRPTFLAHGLPRVRWNEPLGRLRPLAQSLPGSAVQLRALEMLRVVYEATYGTDEDPDRDVDPKSKLIFLWLYKLEDEFMDHLRARNPAALLILAHYAVLFQTVVSGWYLDGWAGHLIGRVRELLGPEYKELARWPAEAAGLS